MRLPEPIHRVAPPHPLKIRRRNRRAITLLAGGVLVASGLQTPAEAGVLSRLKHAIGSLWGQHSARRNAATNARAEAAQINHQKEAIYDRLEDTQRALLQA